MGWVTLDDGQHVFIGAGGKVQSGGPGSKTDATVAKARATKARAIHKARAAASKVLGTWEGVRGKGEIKLYHGTTANNVENIRTQGLINFRAKGYSMLSTRKATAVDAAKGKDGAGTVLEYRVPARDAARYLHRGERTTGIGGSKDVYAAVNPRQPLPGKYIKSIEVLTRIARAKRK